MVSMREQKEKLSKIIEDNNFVEIIEGKVNNSGSVYISTSNKRDLKGKSVVVVVLPEEDS